MTNKFYLFLFTFLFFLSCSPDSDPEISQSNPVEGSQVFRIDFIAIKSQSVSQKNAENQNPAYALFSIVRDDGTSVFTREKIDLIKVGENYATSEITLEVGTYRLTEFIVLDVNDVVIALAPKENAVLSQFAQATLPFQFAVSENRISQSVTEIINAAGYTSVDFGYTGLSLSFPETTDFFSLSVDDSELLTTKIIAIKSLTGSSYVVDWGDGVFEEFVSAKSSSSEVNELSHMYDEQGSYTITISGPIEVIEHFSFSGEIPNAIYQYQSNLLAIDISKLTLLKHLIINKGNLIDIDISSNQGLETLNVYDNALTNIDLSNNPNLTSVFVPNNALTNLDVSQNLRIESLYVHENQLTDLDITNNVNLKILAAYKNELQGLDISNNSNLEYVDVGKNQISSIDSSNNLELATLFVGTNQLNAIDVSKNTKLMNLDIYENQISNLDVSSNTKLQSLWVYNNLLSNLDLANNPDLRYLQLDHNALNSLDLSNNPNITILRVNNNQFNEISLGQVISMLYDRTVLYSITEGTFSYANNPGTANLDMDAQTKLNEMEGTYNWYIYSN